MPMLVVIHPFPVCCSCCYALYLLCISLSEGQLGRHMEHELLLSVHGVDRLRTSLTMWHIQTSSKPVVDSEVNVQPQQILNHRSPHFNKNTDNVSSGVHEGNVSHPLKSCSSTVSPNSCRKSLKACVSSLLLNSSSSDTWWTGETRMSLHTSIQHHITIWLLVEYNGNKCKNFE